MPEVNAFTIGQLLYMLEVETAFIAELLNINAFSTRCGGRKDSCLCPYGKAGLREKKAELSPGLKRKRSIL